MNYKTDYTNTIKQLAFKHGFDFCGIAKADFLAEQAPLLEQWLKNNMHGEMHYMQNYFDKRLDPRLLVEGAKSVISVLYNYYNPNKQTNEEAPKLSMYAYGEDYHLVIKDKLKILLEDIIESIGQINARIFVDSAPVMDKVWAEKAGLGWMGKHTNLINKDQGSYFFIAEIICDIELEYDRPIKDYCGTCTKCIEACPTDAIIKPYVVDGSKCISYFTIELKNEIIPNEYKDKFDNWMFGCDLCQQVCPWNRFAKPHNEPKFLPSEKLLKMSKNEWKELTEEIFNELFKNSAVKRAKYRGLKRNIDFLD